MTDRVLIALGGNAMTGPDGSATQQAQRSAIELAIERVADVLAQGTDVVLTHGNGPQVGNLLVKNELAAGVVPPVSLDWCGAQTQATVGLLTLNALDRVLPERGIGRRPAAVVTRTLVDAGDPGFRHPTKPIGRFVTEQEARRYMAMGQTWEDRGPRGWRRVVASPEPLEVLDAAAIRALVDAGFVVVAAGGGGVPVTRAADDSLQGVEAVLDKDLSAAVLARALGCSALVIATDVDHAFAGYGTPQARPLGHVSAAELRGYAEKGEFASGSMGPKVEAALRFVESGGQRAAITSLDLLADAASGRAGTIVEETARENMVGHDA
jgi:carbamate kinase